jgi:C-terminal processing protease CtpA/Prc
MQNTTPLKPRVILLVAIALLFMLRSFAEAQPKAEVLDRWKAEDDRVARLAGMGRLWGAVKFFHPYLAYKDIDWDKALIETIPRVNAAKSSEEYNAAINHLLSFLNDKNTSAEIVRQTKPTSSPTTEKVNKEELLRVVDGVLIIEVTAIAEALAQDNTAFNQFRERIGTLLPQAKAIVLNCRGRDEVGEYAAYYFDLFTRRALTLILDSNVTLASSRYRIHNGYAPQTGASSGGYYAALIATTPQTVTGLNKAKALPMAVIINDKTPPSSEIVAGLQSTKRVLVVREGDDGKELGIGSFTMKLPEDVRVRIRTTELLYPDGSVGFQPDIVVPASKEADNAMASALNAVKQSNFNPGANRTANVVTLRSVKDNAYPEMEFPNSEYRLLALFRFWNVINYFFPYKNLIDEPWDNILPRYIPRFEANKDALDYQTTLHELAAETQDSHVGVRGATKFFEKLGAFSLPINVQQVEKQTVVTSVLDDKAGIKVGEVVLAIDGEPVERRREYFGRLFAASTPQALALRVNFPLLMGPKDSKAKLTVRGIDGSTREVIVSRSLSASDPKLYLAGTQRSTPAVQVLPSGFGYVDLERLQVGDVDKMFETIKATSATIFDMRGYPHGTAWEIAPRLTEKKDVTAALFLRPFLEAGSLSDDQLTNTSYSFAQKLPKAKGDVYKGKVVMLIDENAISQSEHTCMFFEAATEVTFIGTPTTGANGDVTTMVLPGNLVVGFTGHDVRHADGRQLQRLGIQPHIKAEKTIRGIVDGKDEVLQTAVEYLQTNLNKQSIR